MRRYRGKIDIVAAVLKAAEKGTCKTRIMKKANLSHALLKKYLKTALLNDLIRNEGAKYKITQHGTNFINTYNHFSKKTALLQKINDDLRGERENLEQLCQYFPTQKPIKLKRDHLRDKSKTDAQDKQSRHPNRFPDEEERLFA